MEVAGGHPGGDRRLRLEGDRPGVQPGIEMHDADTRGGVTGEHGSLGQVRRELPESLPVRSHARELQLRLSIGAPLASSRGFGSLDVNETYERAMSLARKLDAPAELADALEDGELDHRNRREGAGAAAEQGHGEQAGEDL